MSFRYRPPTTQTCRSHLLMQYSYFLLLVLATIAFSAQADENILQANSLRINSEPAIVRNLKGSAVVTETNDDEARVQLIEKLREIFSGVKGKLGYFKPSTASVNAISKNPSFTKLTQETDAIPNLMQKQPSLAKQLENPVISTAVDDALSNPSVVKSFKESKEVQKIAERLPTMSKELTPAKIEKMGETAVKTTFLSRGISDVGQQFTAWTLAVVAAIIIFIIGWDMAH